MRVQIELVVPLSMDPKSETENKEVRPHPGPLPQEGEKRFPRPGKIEALDLPRFIDSTRK
jgi:hypothetical protein